MYQFKWLTVSGSSASGLVILPAKISAFFWSQAFFRALPRGVIGSGVSFAPTPWFSGTWFAKWVQGWKFSWEGLLMKSGLIGVAVRSNWFMGGRPRICSIVLVMLTCE